MDKLNINNEKIFSALKKSLYDESPLVRINAIEAIMNSEDSRAESCIKPCLKDPDDEVKKNALIALYNLSDRTILDEVIEKEEYSKYLIKIPKIRDETIFLLDKNTLCIGFEKGKTILPCTMYSTFRYYVCPVLVVDKENFIDVILEKL